MDGVLDRLEGVVIMVDEDEDHDAHILDGGDFPGLLAHSPMILPSVTGGGLTQSLTASNGCVEL